MEEGPRGFWVAAVIGQVEFLKLTNRTHLNHLQHSLERRLFRMSPPSIGWICFAFLGSRSALKLDRISNLIFWFSVANTNKIVD